MNNSICYWIGKARNYLFPDELPTGIKYGWIPDIPDNRDYMYERTKSLMQLPPKVDLSNQTPSVLNQQSLGSCTANAIANAHLYDQLKQRSTEAFLPSRLFIYYNERAMEGTINVDSGAQIRDGIKSIAKQGVCPEKEWPYNIRKYKMKPTAACYKHASQHVALTYYRIDNTNLTDLKSCLASGIPFVFGFSVYESFESEAVAESGIANLPNANEKLLGGHAVLATGYDDSTNRFLIMNSWGKSWGMNGYFTLPYSYLTNTNLAADFWAISTVKI